MRRPPREAWLGAAGAFVAVAGGLAVVGVFSHDSVSGGATPGPTISGADAAEAEPHLTLASSEFNPVPAVCLVSLEPPPCEDGAVSWLSGSLELEPTRFEASPALAAIPRFVEESNTPNEFGAPPPNADDFEARAWDSAGREVPGVVLYLMGMTWMASTDPEGDSSGYIVFVSILLPGTAGFTRVTLEENGTVVHEWTAGAHAPEVDSITLSEGPDGLLIEWAATDADEDDLSYTVSLVDANGERQILGLGQSRETSTLVDWTYSHGPGPHRVVVDVTDGINTSWAVSDPIETSNQPPEIWCVNGDGTEFSTTLRNSFVLELWVLDPEGEDLEDQIVWTSSIDGYLVTGSELYINGDEVIDGPPISLGVHTITATVTDSGGASASLTWTLTVEP